MMAAKIDCGNTKEAVINTAVKIVEGIKKSLTFLTLTLLENNSAIKLFFISPPSTFLFLNCLSCLPKDEQTKTRIFL